MLSELIKKNRSYRRFYQSKTIDTELLRKLVDYARLSPSAANLQYLKYIISNDAEKNNTVFNTLAWAGYLKEWKGPEDGERPSAYIVMLADKNIKKNSGNEIDAGIAAQSILLGAVESGLGGCIFGAVKKKELKEKLNIPDHLDIVIILALGYPKEKVVIEEVTNQNNIKYWRDSDQVHHVPKRKLNDIIINLK